MKRRAMFLFILLSLTLFSCRSSQQTVSNQSQQNANTAPTERSEIFIFHRQGGPADTASSGKPAEGVKVVEGKISGLIVQKTTVKETPSKTDPTKIVYTGSYNLTNGGEIAAIDEQGVHKDSNMVVFLSVSQEGTPLDDTEVLQIGVNMPEGAMFGGFTKAGGNVIRIGGTTKAPQSTNSDMLLGEFRVDPGTQGRLIPAIEVKTDAGNVTIPVKNFIPFKAKPEESKQEKKP